MKNRGCPPLTIGVDFGTDSARAVVVDAATGDEVSSAVAEFPRWTRGLYQDPAAGLFRQHPADYLEALRQCVAQAVAKLTPAQAAAVAGIGVDATGSTPAPVDRNGTPLALLEEFSEDPNAMFQLWKDHTAAAEGVEIDRLLRTGGKTDYTRYQGKYSGEWFWAKVLHTVRTDEKIRSAAYAWVEHCDWLVAQLTGNTAPETMYHSACCIGHKLFWHSEWNGLPGDEALGKADPYLCTVKARFGRPPEEASVRAGSLTPEWAAAFGLPAGIAVSGSSCDAHAGAVGAGIRPGTAVSTVGTSACTMVVERPEAVQGREKAIGVYAGMSENSILPGYLGIESGQASFGDGFAWFRRLLQWPDVSGGGDLLRRLEDAAAQLPDKPFPVSLDWFNGRRYPDTDNTQTAAIWGLNVHVTAPELYRSLVFAACAGLARNIRGFEGAGLTVNDMIAVGGVAGKSPYVMQVLADVLEKEVSVPENSQVCALGAAAYAAVAAGIYPDLPAACRVMAAKPGRVFRPDPAKQPLYREQYEKYLALAAEKDRLVLAGGGPSGPAA